MRELWVGLVNLKPKVPEPDFVGAFTNIVTWASSAAEYRSQVEKMASSYGWYVVTVEEEETVAERKGDGELSEEIEDLVRRAENNPNAIIYGTHHKYPHEDA